MDLFTITLAVVAVIAVWEVVSRLRRPRRARIAAAPPAPAPRPAPHRTPPPQRDPALDEHGPCANTCGRTVRGRCRPCSLCVEEWDAATADAVRAFGPGASLVEIAEDAALRRAMR